VKQRLFDLTICVLALPVLALVGAIVALAVFLDSPGPIFFRAPRIGRDGRSFSMIKFRTMRHGVEGPPLSCEDDERYTPLGRWLSRHRLDELPQIMNVIRGEMRLVGPRPEVSEFVEAFPEQYERILTVVPGLTGPAQLAFASEGELLAAAGDRVEAYRESILPAKIQIDLAYVERPSMRSDATLLFRTVGLPIRRLRRYALMLGAHPTVAPATRALLALSVGVLALSGLFAYDTMA